MTLRRIAVRVLPSILLLVAALCAPASLAAQAGSPYSKLFDVSAFAGYTNSNPAYGGSLYRNNGVSLGLQLDHHFQHIPFNTALEARGTLTTGSAIKENTFLAGVHAERRFLKVLHPYGVALIGPGSLTFNFTNPNGFQSANSIVYSGGAGLDIDVTETFRIKGEYRYEHWTIGKYQTFAPSVFLFGVTYHLPFRPHPEDQHSLYH